MIGSGVGAVVGTAVGGVIASGNIKHGVNKVQEISKAENNQSLTLRNANWLVSNQDIDQNLAPRFQEIDLVEINNDIKNVNQSVQNKVTKQKIVSTLM